jgi:hypothetical protein
MGDRLVAMRRHWRKLLHLPSKETVTLDEQPRHFDNAEGSLATPASVVANDDGSTTSFNQTSSSQKISPKGLDVANTLHPPHSASTSSLRTMKAAGLAALDFTNVAADFIPLPGVKNAIEGVFKIIKRCEVCTL